MKYEEWAQSLRNKFGKKKINTGEYSRIRKISGETTAEFIRRMLEIRENVDIPAEERTSIIKESLGIEEPIITALALSAKEFTEEIIQTIEIIERKMPKIRHEVSPRTKHKSEGVKEIICFFCEAKGHRANECQKKKALNSKMRAKGKGGVNEISDKEFEDLLNKDDFIYVGNLKCLVILDTGAEENYISERLKERLGLPGTPLTRKLTRYAVDGHKIEITENVKK